MPSDTTHQIVNYILLSFLLVCNYYYNIELNISNVLFFMLSYIIGTHYLTPDLDIRSKPSKRLWLFSYPLRKLFKHRGIQHNIVVGWLIRIIYVSIIVMIILYVLKINFNISQINYKILFFMLLGLFLSNLIHIILDKVITMIKRLT